MIGQSYFSALYGRVILRTWHYSCESQLQIKYKYLTDKRIVKYLLIQVGIIRTSSVLKREIHGMDYSVRTQKYQPIYSLVPTDRRSTKSDRDYY